MSFAALAYVSKLRVGSPADKLIALAYADRHNEETGYAYPSIDALVEFSCLNRKTVIASVARLEASGFLADTGERKGHTKQIKVYSLNIETVPETELSPKRNSTGKGVKQSQKRDTEPVRTIISQKTSSSSKRASKPRFVVPDDIPADAWADFEEMRNAIHKPMTLRAKNIAVDRLRELAEAGYPPGEVLNHSILNNYQGLFAPKGDRNGIQRNTTAANDGNGPTVRAAIRAKHILDQRAGLV